MSGITMFCFMSLIDSTTQVQVIKCPKVFASAMIGLFQFSGVRLSFFDCYYIDFIEPHLN